MTPAEAATLARDRCAELVSRRGHPELASELRFIPGDVLVLRDTPKKTNIRHGGRDVADLLTKLRQLEAETQFQKRGTT